MEKFKVLKEIIENRRSIFPPMYEANFELEDQVISDLLELARWAPTHKKTEPWKFIVIRGDIKKEFADFMMEAYKTASSEATFSEMKMEKIGKKVDKSSAVIAICMRRNEDSGLKEWEEVAAVSAAVQNFWLGVTALGLGGYWGSPQFLIKNPTFFDLDQDERCLGIFFIGKPVKHAASSERRPMAEKTVWL